VNIVNVMWYTVANALLFQQWHGKLQRVSGLTDFTVSSSLAADHKFFSLFCLSSAFFSAFFLLAGMLISLNPILISHGDTPNLTFHAPPCTRLSKKRCRVLRVEVNPFYRRKVAVQDASRSSLWIPTQLRSIQSRRNLPGTTKWDYFEKIL
jgi:hypothetical protein